MVRKKASGALLSARKHAIIKDMQAREMAAQSEVPKSMPTRIAELVRELHRRLRDADQGGAEKQR
jgi:RNA polymerase-interacting CarD/CdnL/TRCF family regulator